MTTHDEFEAIAALDAVGAASDEERQALQAHAQSCADCRRARDEYAEAASSFARGLDPVAPPPKVRGTIMDAIGTNDEPGELTEHRRLGDSRWWLGIAATVFFALWGWREISIRVAREHIASKDAEIASLTEEKTVLTQKTEKLSSEMVALASRDTRMISLSGQQVSPSASARVFLEPSKRRAVVFFANLPANPNDKSYQLWIIRADQAKPQSAGVFDVTAPNGTATISVENLPVGVEIKAMAVTLEPKGGVEQPTNTNFYLMGKS